MDGISKIPLARNFATFDSFIKHPSFKSQASCNLCNDCVPLFIFHNHLTSVVHKLLEMYLEDFEKLFVFEKSQLCHRDKNILSKFLVVGLVLGTQITIELNII